MKSRFFLEQVGILVSCMVLFKHVNGERHHGKSSGVSSHGRNAGKFEDSEGSEDAKGVERVEGSEDAKGVERVEGSEDAKGVERVEGGASGSPFDFPFLAVIEQWSGNGWRDIGHVTIYNPWTVLTTITLYNRISNSIANRDIRIVAGVYYIANEVTRQYRYPCLGELHPNNNNNQQMNFAVLHLSEAFRFNKYVSHIQIPRSSDTVSGNCIFAGFAGTGNNFGQLREKVVSLTSGCSSSQANIICTTSGPCAGDEGAPLVCIHSNRRVAYGIAVDVSGSGCPSGNSNYFSMRGLDRSWFNRTLDNGRDRCRDYFKF